MEEVEKDFNVLDNEDAVNTLMNKCIQKFRNSDCI